MKIKAGVFFGGKSVEHEVSVITAMQAIEALDKNKYDVIPFYVSKDNDFYTGAPLARIESYKDIPALLESSEMVDFEKNAQGVFALRHKRKRFGDNVITGLDVAVLAFHGSAGEDGVMQGMFERLDLPYTGCDPWASAAGMDKWTMKALFNAAGIKCLPGVKTLDFEYYDNQAETVTRLAEKIGFPMIIKPMNLGSSVGISLAHNEEMLKQGLETAFTFSPAALCEKAVTPLREINCSVLGDGETAVPSVCEEPVQGGDFLTYADKYQGSAKGGDSGGSKGMQSLSRKIPADIPAELEAEIKSMAVAAFHAIGAAGVSRVDFLMNADTMEIWVNEINTIPGSLSFYLWEHTGKSFSTLLDELVSLAFKRQREKSRRIYGFDTNILSNPSLGGKKTGK